MRNHFLMRWLVAGALLLPLVVHAELATQFNYNVTSATGGGVGHAAVGFDGTHLWVARWASADIAILQADGTFVEVMQVAALSGIRSLTWDGSHFRAADATTTLPRIDPVTRTVVDTATAPISTRYASFDPTANGGAGGFWIGEFKTDILLIDLDGNTLQTLPASGFPALTGRYGIAFDNMSGPQPFLWVFSQTPPSSSTLSIIDIGDGTARPNSQDLFAGLGLTSALAGGLFLTDGLVPGERSLLALLQGTPDNILLGLQPAATVPVELQRFEVD